MPNQSHLNPSITEQQYLNAVSNLLSLAQCDCGGSGVCAQVLLSVYNGEEYQLNLVDLGRLDLQLYNDAITVIRARTELRIEPQELMHSLDLIFKELWQQWQCYHVKNRGKGE